MRGSKAVVALAMLLAVALVGGCEHKTTASTTPPAIPAGNKTPPKQFLEDWRDFAALRDEIKALETKDGLRGKYDQLNGMATRLQGQVPDGYVWDEDTLSFKPKPVTPLPPPVTAPAKPEGKK